MAAATESNVPEDTDLSKHYDTPIGVAHGTMQALKDCIKLHYDLASDYYLRLWGEHIHHGYWPTPESKTTESKEQAQINLIRLLLDISALPPGSRVLDVGCGIGGTSRYLASQLGCAVTGVTISSKQVELAKRLSRAAAAKGTTAGESAEAVAGGEVGEDEYVRQGEGRVRFIELDAERMGEYFASGGDDEGQDEAKGGFDGVWISEALSHFPNKEGFFRNAFSVLKPGGKLVIADWFKAEGLEETNTDIKAIEDGMLLPPLCTQAGYVKLATDAGLKVLATPLDISGDVSKTWDISWSLVQNPALWAFALSQGRDGLAFLQSFRAMRRGYSNGSFRYAVMAFEKGAL